MELKRDEIVEQAREAWNTRDLHAGREFIMADFALKIATVAVAAERAKEASDLKWLMAAPTNFVDLCGALRKHIEALEEAHGQS